MFKTPFSFDGRIRRTEYGITFIIYLAMYLLINVLIYSGSGGGIFALILLIPTIWFLWAQGAKRCHDMGRSGWWQIIPFYVFVMIFSEGDRGKNEYGSNPKFPEEVDVLESETLDGHLKN